ncbi:MAG: hypothetical protein NTY35_13530 [Planctomycetota bacterium]|nr:hypothetical protein [Planctomycetota bacterium]
MVTLAAFLALVVLRGGVLYDPPYWDALLGLFPQAHWQALHGLSPWSLLSAQPGYVDGGACVYPFSAIPTALALLERALPDPEPRFAILHLATFACASQACGAVFRLTRRWGRGLAWLAAAAFLFQPGVQALACQVGLEMPLVAAVACGVAALVERRWAASFAWAAAALLVKPTGVVLAAAALCLLLARALFPRLVGARAAGERAWTFAHAALCAVFVAQIAVLHAFERAPAGTGFFQGLAPLATKRLWTVPEFGLALAVLACAGFAAGLGRARAARARGAIPSPIPLAVSAPALLLLAYLGLLAQWENALPRYFIAAYPAVLVLLVEAGARFAPRAAHGPAALGLTLFGLLGAHGRFHPDRPASFAAPGESTPLAANDGWLLERSLRYRDGLALDQELARYASSRPEAAFVAPWPLQQALVEPAFGYVERSVACASAETSVAWTREPPPSLAALRASGRDILWILTPNDFGGAASRPLPGDEVVARFAVGEQRAVVVRRGNFP